MKSICPIILPLMIISCSNAKQKVGKIEHGVVNRYEVKLNGKYGYIDSNGTIKIAPKYNRVGSFHYNLAPASIGGVEKIDTFNKFNGQMIGDHWAIAKVMKGDKWGFIDTAGRFVIKPIYEHCFDFTNGIAAVREGDKCGYIDTTGRYVIPPIYEDALPFYDEYAAVSITNSDSTCSKYYYIDKNGNIMFRSPADVSFSFINDVASVSILNKGPDSLSFYFKHGYIDKKGKYIVKPKYDVLGFYYDGRAMFGIRPGNQWKCGYLNCKGKEIIPAKYSFATDFGDSIAWVVQDGKLFLIDINGKVLRIISSKYENVTRFSESLSAVKINGKWGYCDKQGNMAIESQYDTVTAFDRGLAGVVKGKITGYINKQGKYIWTNKKN